MENPRNFYTEIEKGVMQNAREFYGGVKEFIEEKNHSGLGEKIEQESLDHFQKIYADLPDIGGPGNSLIQSYIYSAIALGFFTASRENGILIEEAGRITYEIIEYFYRSEEGSKTLETASRESIMKQKEHMRKKFAAPFLPDDWKTVLIEDDDQEFDIGWNNTECGILKLYKKYNAGEYVLFMCMTDAISYPLRGLGLTRTRTLADSDRCDFRVKLGGETRLEPAARGMLKKWGKH